jgi:hypothetical protein
MNRNLVGSIYGRSSIKIANYPLWPCLLMDPDKMSNLYRGPSIDASYQVSVHLAKRFQRRRFFKIGQSETRIACGGHVSNLDVFSMQTFLRGLIYVRRAIQAHLSL